MADPVRLRRGDYGWKLDDIVDSVDLGNLRKVGAEYCDMKIQPLPELYAGHAKASIDKCCLDMCCI